MLELGQEDFTKSCIKILALLRQIKPFGQFRVKFYLQMKYFQITSEDIIRF